MAQKVWVEWIEQGLANGEYNRYDYKDLTDIEQIGSSKVYKALMKRDDEEETMVTMKYIGNKLSTREVQSELKLLRYIQSLDNENISKFYGVTKSDSNDKNQLKYMVMLEYGDGGTLREYLQNDSENLHWSVRLKFARQLSNAIAFLHLIEKPKLVHKNLHSHNIIINQQNLKLKVLGITCKMSESSNISTNLQQYLAYIDPQYFKIPSYKSSDDKQSTLTKKSDIYSLGILLWELSSKMLPFSSEDHSDLQKEIMEGLREKDIDGTDQAYISIYKKCWQSEPDDRPEILEVVSALEELDDGIDPSMVQKDKKVKPIRKYSIKEPPAPAPPVIKPVKPSPTKPQINTTPPPPSKSQVNTTPPPPKPQVNITPSPPKPQVNITLPPPKPKVNITPPQPKPPPPKPQINNTPPPPIISIRRESPKIRSKSPEATIIEEDEGEGEGESTRINSPIGSESSTISAITMKSDIICQSPVSKTKPSFKSSILKSESPRSLSPNKRSSIRQSRPKSKSPMGRVVGRSPSRKSLTRAISPNFTTREPRTVKRSASVSLPRNTPKFSRRAQTLAPPQPRSPSPPLCSSPKKFVNKPTNRRYSTGIINSSMQINVQSSLIGMWSNTSDRREDPTKKIIDELLSLFMETYEIDPGHTLLKSIQEFLENQEEETFKIFDWLLTTQLSLQYEILLGYFYLNGIGTSVGNRKAFVLFLSAAKKQYAIAQDLLGYCYFNGKGTVKDEVLGFKWYQKAAANGCVTAFQSLGECYHNGNGTIKNKSRALQYFKSASDGGNICGKNMLAYCYEMGLGVSSDHKKAFYLYKQAADAGYNLAKRNVAKCYQNGIGVAVDLEAAAYWLEKSN